MRPSHSELEVRFTRLLSEHGPSLARVAGSYTRDRMEREDLFQEIAIAIWRALPSFRGDCSERTFLFRIAHNRGLTHLARRGPKTTVMTDELRLRDARPDPEQALWVQQRGQNVAHAVQRLPIAYRQVVTLALEGMSYAEIADVLGITESNVGARLTRARQMLRQAI